MILRLFCWWFRVILFISILLKLRICGAFFVSFIVSLAYQVVRNVSFSENLACFVFLKRPFEIRLFALLPMQWADLNQYCCAEKNTSLNVKLRVYEATNKSEIEPTALT